MTTPEPRISKRDNNLPEEAHDQKKPTGFLKFFIEEYPAIYLILGLLGMVGYFLHDGSQGITYMIIGFGFGMGAAFNLNTTATKLFTVLMWIILIGGVGGIFLLDHYPHGGTPIELKWIYTLTGLLLGVICMGAAKSAHKKK